MSPSRPLRSLFLFVLSLITLANIVNAQVKPGSGSQSANRSGLHQQDSRIHDRAILQLAIDGLLACFTGCSDSKSRAWRRFRRARQAAVRRRRLQVHADAGARKPASESLFNRHDGRRPRDDRRRDCLANN